MANNKEYWHLYMSIWKTIILTGFLKSTIGTSFISIGVALIFNGLINEGVRETFYLYGIIAVLIGCVIYFVGDVYKRKKEEENVEIIQDKTEKIVQDESDKIKEEMKKIIEEEEDRKDKAIKRRFNSLETGLCAEVEKSDDGNNVLKEYCKSRHIDYSILIYPQDFPMKEVLKVGRQKAVAQGETPDEEWMDTYLKALYNGGFINLKQYTKGLHILGGEL